MKVLGGFAFGIRRSWISGATVAIKISRIYCKRMHPLMEESSNTAGRKRKTYIEEDDFIVEGIAADWQAAKIKKKSKRDHNSLAPPQTWQDADPGLEEDDLRGRTLQRTGSGVDEPVSSLDSPEAMKTSRKYTADPTLLPPKKKGKKLKYYGVLLGREPGIYYSWDDAEPQVKGWSGTVYIASPDATEIEDFMNHEPADCRWAICGGQCFNFHRPQDNTVARSAPSVAVEAPQLSPLDTSNRSPSIDSALKTICNCARPENNHESTVQCANALNCEVGTYHNKCVGLASRKETTGWRCVACRPLPSSIKPTSSTASSHQQSSQPTNEIQISQRVVPFSSAVSIHFSQRSRNHRYTLSKKTLFSVSCKARMYSIRDQLVSESLLSSRILLADLGNNRRRSTSLHHQVSQHSTLEA